REEVVVQRDDERFHRQHEAEEHQREEQLLADHAEHAERVAAQDRDRGPEDHHAARDDQARLQVLAEPGLLPGGDEVRPLQVSQVDRPGRTGAERVKEHPHKREQHGEGNDREQRVGHHALSAGNHSDLPSASLTITSTTSSETMVMTTPIAAADPTSGLANARSYRTTGGVSGETAGPPVVVSARR